MTHTENRDWTRVKEEVQAEARRVTSRALAEDPHSQDLATKMPMKFSDSSSVAEILSQIFLVMMMISSVVLEVILGVAVDRGASNRDKAEMVCSNRGRTPSVVLVKWPTTTSLGAVWAGFSSSNRAALEAPWVVAEPHRA